MGNGSSDEQEEITETCSFCGTYTTIAREYFPHEAGGYCIFAPRDEIEYACKKCVKGVCEFCGAKHPRFCFIDCDECGKRHCFNNTDMKYENNPFLSDYVLCEAYKKLKYKSSRSCAAKIQQQK